MINERKKQDAAMAKLGPTLAAQKEYRAQMNKYNQQVQAAQAHLKAILRTIMLGQQAVEKTAGGLPWGPAQLPTMPAGPSSRKDSPLDNKALVALHQAGKNIENLGAVNKALRKAMLDLARTNRPPRNPSKEAQLALPLVIKQQWQRHKDAAQAQNSGEWMFMGHRGEIEMAEDTERETAASLRNLGMVNRDMYRYMRNIGAVRQLDPLGSKMLRPPTSMSKGG